MRSFILTCVTLCVATFSTASSASLIYELTPGSTITILGTGETESLSGSFTWENTGLLGEYVLMTPTALSFTSNSVSIQFNPGNPDQYGTSVFLVNDPDRCSSGVCETFFNAAVTATGLGTSDSLIFAGFGDGGYDGDPNAPSSVYYTSLMLVPEAGGAFLARLNFSANLTAPVSAPEPSTFALMLTGLGILGISAFRRKRIEPALHH